MIFVKKASVALSLAAMSMASVASAQTWTATSNPTYFSGTATVASTTATLTCDVSSGFWVNVPSSGAVGSVGAATNPFPSGSGLGALFCSSVKVDSTPWALTLSNKRTVSGVVTWDVAVSGVSAYNLMNQNCTGNLSGTYNNSGQLNVSGTLTGAATCGISLAVTANSSLAVN